MKKLLAHWSSLAEQNDNLSALHVSSKQRRSQRRYENFLHQNASEHRKHRSDLTQRVRKGLLAAKGQ